MNDGTVLSDDETLVGENDFTVVQSENVEIPPSISQNLISVENPFEELIKQYTLIEQDRYVKLKEKNDFISLDALLECFSINEDEVYKALSEKLNKTYYTLESIENILKDVDFKILDINQQKKLHIIVLKHENEQVEVIVGDPYDFELIDFLTQKYSDNFLISIATKKTINKTIAKLRKKDKISHLIELDETVDSLDKDSVDEYSINEDHRIPIIPLVNYIVLNAQENRVSDIHIEPTEENMLVRYRVDGVLDVDVSLPVTIHREVVSRIKILSDMNVAEKRLPQDGRFSITDKSGSKLDIRVSTFPTVYGEKLVMRLLEQDALKPSLEDLNLTNDQLQLMKDKINSPYGLILITGPTGSGKTTTLYSALSTVDRDKLNVLTVEDPVEYRLDGVHQMQVNDKIGLTFASGLRTILRQDPDVVMLGEIRDLETANMAIRASLTGHIVFSTLHTNDAVGVIIRLINMGIDPFLVASSVSLAVAQRLVRTVCKDCIDIKDIDELRDDLARKGITQTKLDSLHIDIDELPDAAYGKGCEYCRGTGYRGRQAVFEFFELTPEIVSEILKPSVDEMLIRKLAKEAGMRSLVENSWDLVIDGVTTVEELVRVVGGE
ncbi:MAG: GspE/PulE family protein [Campylobacterota bacterium]|nr:GspE/PulE family protein [Campylobacterota bacterium]